MTPVEMVPNAESVPVGRRKPELHSHVEEIVSNTRSVAADIVEVSLVWIGPVG